MIVKAWNDKGSHLYIVSIRPKDPSDHSAYIDFDVPQSAILTVSVKAWNDKGSHLNTVSIRPKDPSDHSAFIDLDVPQSAISFVDNPPFGKCISIPNGLLIE